MNVEQLINQLALEQNPLSRADIFAACHTNNVPFNPVFRSATKLSHGQYTYNPSMINTLGPTTVALSALYSPTANSPLTSPNVPVAAEQVVNEEPKTRVGRVLSDLPESCIPKLDKTFVGFGDFSLVRKAIDSKKFFCWFVAGESGAGKTTLVEQACALSGRELITVSISKATTESDLMGDFRLLNGETPYYYGPVAEAAKRGAVLLLDELTQGDAMRLMCLQSVMAGKSIHIKKTGEIIEPAPGFAILCTGNSVGEGDTSDSQMYVGEEILNEAFRDRITAVIYHEMPPAATEKKILINHLGKEEEDFATALVRWANITRENYKNGTQSRQISTRRLLHIATNYKVTGDKVTALKLALNRYEKNMATALFSSYVMIDSSIDPAILNE